MPDLSSLDTKANANVGRTLTLKHPVDGSVLMTDEKKPAPMTITLHGLDSDNYAKHLHLARARILEEQGKAPDLDESNRRNAEGFAAVTIDWHLWLDGGLVPFSKEKALEMYIRFPWIREQVDVFVSNRKNFI